MSTALLGDIGGTNARYALARDGKILPDSAFALVNDDFATFEEMLQEVMARTGAVDAISLAAAGPLVNGDIRLTNRDWVVTAETLGRHANKLSLVNDLTAHVLAVPFLPEADQRTLRDGQIAPNGQWLVVNLGTGFNAAQGVMAGDRPLALEAERGLTPLPAAVAARLAAAGAEVPECCDAFFSGPGLARLKMQIEEEAPQIFSLCLADFLRELITATLPFDGVYLCGGVAKLVAEGPGLPGFLDRLEEPYVPYGFLRDVPVRLMTASDAALRGCLAALG